METIMVQALVVRVAPILPAVQTVGRTSRAAKTEMAILVEITKMVVVAAQGTVVKFYIEVILPL
jgi:hypothetical protein